MADARLARHDVAIAEHLPLRPELEKGGRQTGRPQEETAHPRQR